MLCFGSVLALSVKHAHEHAEHAQGPGLHQHIDRPTWLNHVAKYLHQQEERGCSKACWLTMQNVVADNARNLIVNATGRPAANRTLGTGSDGEGVDALLAFFYESWTGKGHHIAGISLELGGLDGVTESQTLKLEEEAGFRRVVIEADVSRRKQRLDLAPEVVGVTAAVCDQPGTVHYIGKGYTAGVAEFMPSTFLHRWYPSVERALSKVGDRWEKVDFKALRPPSTEVPCVSLSHILDTELRLRWIDFAILDTEGAELSILKTVDWQRIHFGVLVIEDVASTRPISYRKDIIDYMLNHTGGQYKVIFSVRGRNTWFMHRDFVATAQAPREDPTSRSGSFYRWSAPYM